MAKYDTTRGYQSVHQFDLDIRGLLSKCRDGLELGIPLSSTDGSFVGLNDGIVHGNTKGEMPGSTLEMKISKEKNDIGNGIREGRRGDQIL